MENPINSFDVFEFKEEDELAETTAKKSPPKSGYPHAPDDVSFTPIKTEDFAKDGTNFNHAMHHDFKNPEQAAEIKSRNIEYPSVFASGECGSCVGAALRLGDNLNADFQQSSCNDMSAHFTSDADGNMSFSDGPLAGNCSNDWDLEDERVGIVFYPDYVDYCGTHYLHSMVNFSRSFVEARSINLFGDERSFEIHLEFEDIIKIETQWSAQYEAGIINIYFLSKDGVQEDIIYNGSAPGLLELKFPAVDPNWYQKQEAIGSLDVRYKALWNVILDTGMEKISPLTEGKSMRRTKKYFPEFDKPFEEVIYPKGDPDAVSISKRDADLLLPETFVNDTIIDFYIKYLKSKLNAEERTRFHFFNSFFFRKLADMDKDPSSALDGKAAFQRVRKWTRKINLLEKDFIFIPVNYNYHWSLVVICYFGEVVRYKDEKDGKSSRVPCILHMDSLVGNHVVLKDLLQSYLWEEWKERYKETSEDLHSNFKTLKFIPLELPQQQNSYDCGLFLLHYVELFLEEVPSNFSIYQITSSTNFLQADWFPPSEASMKRTHIERLIDGLLNTQSKNCPPFDGIEMHRSSEGLKAIHGYDNGVAFSTKSNPTSACCESSLHQVDQGIEMTLLPPSSTSSAQCNRTSDLVLKDLFAKTSVPKPFNDASWGVLGSSVSPPEEEIEEANECFVEEELTEHDFRRVDGVTIDESAIPYTSGYFRLNSLNQPTSGSDSYDDMAKVEDDEEEKWPPVEVSHDELDNHKYLSPARKNEHPDAEKSCSRFKVNDLIVEGSFTFQDEGLSVGPTLDDEEEKWPPVEVSHDELDNHKYLSPARKNEHPDAEKSCSRFKVNDLIVEGSFTCLSVGPTLDELDNHKYLSPARKNEHPDAEKSCSRFKVNDLNVEGSFSFQDEGLSVGPTLDELDNHNYLSPARKNEHPDAEKSCSRFEVNDLIVGESFTLQDEGLSVSPTLNELANHIWSPARKNEHPDAEKSCSRFKVNGLNVEGSFSFQDEGLSVGPTLDELDNHNYLSPARKNEHPDAEKSCSRFEVNDLIVGESFTLQDEGLSVSPTLNELANHIWSPARKNGHPDAEKSCSRFKVNDLNVEGSCSLQDEGLSVGPTLASGDESGVALEVVLELGEQRLAKRMRTESPNCGEEEVIGDHLINDLHL